MSQLKKFIFIFLSVWGISSLGYAVEQEAQLFKTGMELYGQGQFDESAKILIRLIKKNPQKPLYWFNLGNCAFMTKRYHRSLRYYDKTISLKSPLSPAAKLYEAKALRKLGRYDEAIALLTELGNESPPPGIFQESTEDLKAIREQQQIEESALAAYQAGRFTEVPKILSREPEADMSTGGRLLLSLSLMRQNKAVEAEGVLRKLSDEGSLADEDQTAVHDLLKRARRNDLENTPYWLYSDVSAGYTSNAYLDGRSVSPVASSLVRASLGGGYHFNKEKAWSEKIGYIMNYENPLQAPALETLIHTVQGGLVFKSSHFDSSLNPYFQQQSWDNTLVSNKVGATVKSYYTGANYEVGVDVDGYSQSSVNTTYSYLSGNGFSVRPYYGVWGSVLYTQVYWLTGFDGTQDIIYSDGSILPLKHNFQGPGLKLMWRLSPKSALAWNLSYIMKTYTDLSEPGGKARNDNEIGSWLKFSYLVAPRMRVYGLGEYTSNSSTLGAADVLDKNYNILTFSLGMSWDIF